MWRCILDSSQSYFRDNSRQRALLENMEYSKHTRYIVIMRRSNFTFRLLSGGGTDLSIDFHEYCLATFFK